MANEDEEPGGNVHNLPGSDPTASPADGAGNGAASIEERTNEEGEAEAQLQIEELAGDKPLTLGGLGPRGQNIQSEVSIMSAAVPVKGLLEPDKQGQLLVTYVPRKYEYVPVREEGRTVRWTLRQQVRPSYVAAANTASALESVVMNCVSAGMSLEEINEAVREALVVAEAA